MTLLGYVRTDYARRPLADAKADVDGWVRLYPDVRGIFFDEQSSGADQVAYYAALYEHARKKHRLGLVVTNPGTTCDEGTVSRPACDAVCLFENHDGFRTFHAPGWAGEYPAARFAALPYRVRTAREMRRYVSGAPGKRLGLLYVTDEERNHWKRLPTYWEDEVKAVEEVNRAGK